MMQKTKIDWADYTYNPITGCSKGCSYCYAAKLVKRFPHIHGQLNIYGGSQGDVPFSVPWFHPNRLDGPMKVKKRSRIFCCSMGDLFDPGVEKDWRDRVFKVMGMQNRHTFIVLTKRQEEAKQYIEQLRFWGSRWTLPNLWLGVSVENQETADERIPTLLDIPVAKRIVSIEPMLGPVDLHKLAGGYHDDKESGKRVFHRFIDGLNWVIVGAQTNPKVLPKATWVRKIVWDCREAGVSVFLKGNLEWLQKIQEYPG
jgi:protein gp37